MNITNILLWLQTGHERETAVCLMQKFIDRPNLQIKSVVALEHLKNFIYIEAEKEAHVKEVSGASLDSFIHFGTVF